MTTIEIHHAVKSPKIAVQLKMEKTITKHRSFGSIPKNMRETTELK